MRIGSSFALLLAGAALQAQTTQGVISGWVRIRGADEAPRGAKVHYQHLESGVRDEAAVNTNGYFVIAELSPGRYRIEAQAAGYQTQMIEEQELPVAGRVDLDFRLRLLEDKWGRQANQIVYTDRERLANYYATDVERLESALVEVVRPSQDLLHAGPSAVIGGDWLRNLPLAGRDVYTLLLSQPGVTSDLTTTRGLGLAAVGQRPSASNFFLDGTENNNYLVTGPLSVAPPEAIQEYRISTAGYSAEFGRTSGYVANAITRQAGEKWHGTGWFYLKNQALNATDFQRNWQGLGRAPLGEQQSGLWIGGPLRGRISMTLAIEGSHFRSEEDPQAYSLLTAGIASRATGPAARAILQAVPMPDKAPGNFLKGTPCDKPNPPSSGGQLPDRDERQECLAAPNTVNRFLAIPRLDWRRDRGLLTFRAAVTRISRPDYNWSPYPQYVSPLTQNSSHVSVGWLSKLAEVRLAVISDELRLDRPHPEVPILQFSGERDLPPLFPGSPARYGLRHRSTAVDGLVNFQVVRGEHVAKFGGGGLFRHIRSDLTTFQSGNLTFSFVPDFLADRVSTAELALQPGTDSRADGHRGYSVPQFFGYAQDSWRVTPRWMLELGVRYEWFGPPRNTGAPDMAVDLGAGATFAGRLAAACPGKLCNTSPSGQAYDTDWNNVAGRLGWVYRLSTLKAWVLRGSVGIFYDRPFDNLWLTLRDNASAVYSSDIPFRTPFPNYYPSFTDAFLKVPRNSDPSITAFTLIQPGLRTPYAQTATLGISGSVTDELSVEFNGLGSFARKLLTTDRPIRPPADSRNPSLRYRGNQGLSNYWGFSSAVRYRGSRLQVMGSYTLSWSTDTQSEALDGEFSDLRTGTAVSRFGRPTGATFPIALDSRSNRGASDFDQRHNLMLLSVWRLPEVRSYGWRAAILRGWTISQMTAVRSGLAYSVYGPNSGTFYNNFADRAGAVGCLQPGVTIMPGPGQAKVLERADFQKACGQIGNLGRNPFHGPGSFNMDTSLARQFLFREHQQRQFRMITRLDAYNVWNHANLGIPVSILGDPGFGYAGWGQTGRASAFPLVAPLKEQARQLQVLLRIEF